LLGMLEVLHLPAHHGGGGSAHALTLGDELGWSPLQVLSVRNRHVIGRGGMSALARLEGMGGPLPVASQNFDCGGRMRNST
jgi:hypothetical protein